MPQFKYRAITASGRNKSGTIEAADKRQAISQLKGKMRQILSVTEQEVSKKGTSSARKNFGQAQKKKNLLMEQPLSLPVV